MITYTSVVQNGLYQETTPASCSAYGLWLCVMWLLLLF